MTHALSRRIGLLIGLGLLLGGCAMGAGEGRPILGMDGQHLDASDPLERGRALILTGQYGLAIEELDQLVGRQPGNARALTLLALAYGQVKRFDLADRYHARALELDPDSPTILNNWGYSYLVRGDERHAAELLERAASAGGGRPIIAANLALARGGAPSVEPSGAPVPPETEPAREVRLSSHVTLVRAAPRLRRIAPGIQMLVTADTDDSTTPSAASQAMLPLLPASNQDSVGDPRFKLFQALSSLIEGGEPGLHGAVRQQLAETSFGIVSDVDDFTRP